MVAGALTGWLLGPDAAIGSVKLLPILDLVGSLFINLLKMLIVPLILSSVITGVAALGTGPDLGRLGGKTLGFYVLTTLIAVLIALALVNIVEPGVRDGQPVRALLALSADAAQVTQGVMSRADTSMLETIRAVVPDNIVQAAANTKMLGLVLFSILFGFFLARIPQPQQGHGARVLAGHLPRHDAHDRFRDAARAHWCVCAHRARSWRFRDSRAPGLCCCSPAAWSAGLAIYGFVALPILLATVARVNPWRLFPAMAPALLTAFSTASSSATLPLSLECLEERAKVSPRIAGFVMPLGASMNHAGSALYECAAAMFIAQAYGLHLPFGTQFTVVILALVTSMGMAGIPAASLVGIAVILAAVGLPAEAIGVLLVFDRILDMCRTAINVLADAACTVIVARLEGETGILERPEIAEKVAG